MNAEPTTDADLCDGAAIRPMRPDDADQIAQLDVEARAALADARGGAAWIAETPPTAWRDAVDDPRRRVWVATIDDVVVGALELIVPDQSGIGIVRQVYVHPEARELGFGDTLLERAMAAIVLAGGHTVEATALPGDRDTKNLYERAGVTARKLTVSRRLVP